MNETALTLDDDAKRNEAGALMVEAAFGEWIPKCRQCGSFEVFENYARACHQCASCGRVEANENLYTVPKDERVREAMGL